MPLMRLLVFAVSISTVLIVNTDTSTAFETASSSSSSSDKNTCPTASTNMAKLRSVKKVLPRPSPHWVGDGFRVYPVFSDMAFTQELSPLLMFDYAEPKQFPPAKLVGGNKPRGVGQHAHRGFQTVTIAWQGQVEHHDSKGNTGVIHPGDVQWMTAGRGIIHEEYHSKEFTKQGGTFEMAQLWINLPQKYKMTKPGYQGIVNEKIPVVNLPLGATNEDDEIIGTARVIAGTLGEIKGAAKTFSPVQVWDITFPDAKDNFVDLPIPSDHSCMVFVRRGSIEIVAGGDEKENNKQATTRTLQPQEVAILSSNDGSDTVRLRVSKKDTSILILGGEPLNEPIAHQGPFVMNTQDQIYQAISDYRLGKMGR